MNFKFIYILSMAFVLFSCKDDSQKRLVETQKDIKKKELIFSNIEKGWVFNANPINSTSLSNKSTWKEWGLFLTELEQKPKKTIGAFQKKSTEISKKVMDLNNSIPIDLNQPQIRSRISALITKVRMLDLYIQLDNIPYKKVVVLVGEINTELASMQNQMDLIVRKSKIPLEDGESELKMMLDTARAIPNVIIDPNFPRVK